MSNIQKTYGAKKGKQVYYALEAEGKMKPKPDKASSGAMSKLSKGK